MSSSLRAPEPQTAFVRLDDTEDARPPWAPTLPLQKGFGTLSWQLGNDEGYRSSCGGVSGPLLDSRTFTDAFRSRRSGGEGQGCENRHRAVWDTDRRRKGGLRTAF
jgi:hypothetical protein